MLLVQLLSCLLCPHLGPVSSKQEYGDNKNDPTKRKGGKTVEEQDIGGRNQGGAGNHHSTKAGGSKPDGNTKGTGLQDKTGNTTEPKLNRIKQNKTQVHKNMFTFDV